MKNEINFNIDILSYARETQMYSLSLGHFILSKTKNNLRVIISVENYWRCTQDMWEVRPLGNTAYISWFFFRTSAADITYKKI